jgi:hypothetical protein
MNTLRKWVLVAAFGVAAAPAYADNYSILFTVANGGPDASGTFTYANGTFSDFDVEYDGLTFDLSSDASAVSGVGGCSGGPGVSTFNYFESSTGCGGPPREWSAASLGVGPGATFLFSVDYQGFGKSLAMLAPAANSIGTFVVTDLSTHAAPELDPNSAVGCVTFLVGSLAVLAGCRPRRMRKLRQMSRL